MSVRYDLHRGVPIGDFVLIVTITLLFLCLGISFKRNCFLIFSGSEERLVGLLACSIPDFF